MMGQAIDRRLRRGVGLPLLGALLLLAALPLLGTPGGPGGDGLTLTLSEARPLALVPTLARTRILAHPRIITVTLPRTRTLPLLRTLALPLTLIAGAGELAAQEVEVQPEGTFRLEGAVARVAFSSDGRLVAAADARGGLGIWPSAGGDRLASSDGRGEEPFLLAFLAGDSAVVRLDGDGAVFVRGLEEGAAAEEVGRVARPVRAVLDPARRTLAVLGAGERIEFFDLPTRQRIREIDARGAVGDLLYLGFDRQGRQLLAVRRNGEATAWNPATGEVIRRVTLQSDELHGSRTVVHAAEADRNANILVAAIEEVALPRGGLRGPARPGDLVRRDILLVLDWYSGAEIRRVPALDGVVEVLAVGPGNDHAVITRNERVNLMDLRAGERGPMITAPGPVRALAISSDQQRLAIGAEGGEVAVWSMAYRERTVADALDAPPEGVGSRLRILGESAPAIPAGEGVVLAVLPFDDRDSEGRLSRTVAELLTTQLANVPGLRLVERLRIDALLEEQDLQMRGITEPGGLELGRMLNADYVLLGNVGASGTTLTFGARLLHVESGEVVSGRQVLCEDCHARDLFDAIHLLGTAIARP